MLGFRKVFCPQLWCAGLATQFCRGAAFSSRKARGAFVNLSASPGYEHRWWGRAIFRVDDVDAQYRALQVQGLVLESPRNAPWGECFFHLSDPDGPELSFAIAGR